MINRIKIFNKKQIFNLKFYLFNQKPLTDQDIYMTAQIRTVLSLMTQVNKLPCLLRFEQFSHLLLLPWLPRFEQFSLIITLPKETRTFCHYDKLTTIYSN